MTMYRLMIRFLTILLLAATVLSATGLLPYSWITIVWAGLYLPTLAWLFDRLLARLLNATCTGESAIITGLIIALVTGPLAVPSTITQLSGVVLVAIASKYVLAINRRHIFNPAATGVLVAGLAWQQGASWWIGNAYLWPLVVVGGLLIASKVRRWPAVLTFLAIGALTWNLAIWANFLALPIMFFAFVMLLEPQTSPGRRTHQYIYGASVALLWALMQHFSSNYPYSLETALLLGNVVYWIMARDRQLTLTVTGIKKHSPRAATFTFSYANKLAFTAGQYVQWTLPHPHADNRGIRRWFTISASPTEDDLAFTTTFTDKSSSYKTALQKLQVGDTVTAAGLSGDFVLPKDPKTPLVFIAGGVGITPFRSMITYLIDTNQSRDIVLLYSNRTQPDILFAEVWKQAKTIGVTTVHTLTGETPKGWDGETGYIDAGMIKRVVPHWHHRHYYVSGPEPMVTAFTALLTQMGIPSRHIKKDFFPGYTDTHQA